MTLSFVGHPLPVIACRVGPPEPRAVSLDQGDDLLELPQVSRIITHKNSLKKDAFIMFYYKLVYGNHLTTVGLVESPLSLEPL